MAILILRGAPGILFRIQQNMTHATAHMEGDSQSIRYPVWTTLHPAGVTCTRLAHRIGRSSPSTPFAVDKSAPKPFTQKFGYIRKVERRMLDTTNCLQRYRNKPFDARSNTVALTVSARISTIC
jgi:hypothetical protein